MTVVPTTAEAELTWATELDRLELDLHRLESRPADHTDAAALGSVLDWEEPRGLGPIPPALVARARTILARQQRVAADLAGALDRTGRQQRYAAHVTHSVTAPQLPAYLDVTA